MGRPGASGERKTFFGTSEGEEGNPAKLSEALESAAAEAIKQKFVSKDQAAWFDITSMEVLLANQHPRTFKVGVTLKDPQPPS